MHPLILMLTATLIVALDTGSEAVTRSSDYSLPASVGTAAASTAEVPGIESLKNVVAGLAEYRGKQALSLELAPEEQALQRAGAGGNRPTYAVVPGNFQDGTIEVDISANLNGRGGAESRGFAGIVFRLADDERFDAVYLRAANGSLNDPAPSSPRDVRAIQYISHPDFHFSESRALAPGIYEKGAPVAKGTWHRLSLDISGRRLVASVDGVVVLEVNDLRLDRAGKVALWVGDGTLAYFANLRVVPAKR